MQVYINAEARDYPQQTTLTQLVELLNLNLSKVAMEVNLTIIPRSLYPQTVLNAGDRVEIVQFMGGG